MFMFMNASNNSIAIVYTESILSSTYKIDEAI